MKLSVILGGAVAAVSILSTPMALAYETFRFATSAPTETVWDMQTIRYSENLDEISDSEIEIDAYNNSQLGSEQDVIQQVARGRIDMAGVAISSAAVIVPELALLNLPFLFKSPGEQDCVFDKMAEPTADLFSKKNLQFLSWTHVGQTNLVGKKAFVKPDDLKGLRARSQMTKVASYMWTAAGADPIPLPITEWNTAHQTGMVDVSEAPVAYYFYSGLGEIANVMTLTRHVEQVGVVVMNQKRWNGLSAETHAMFVKAGERAPLAMLRKEIREFEERTGEYHKNAGGKIVKLNDDQRMEWRKVMSSYWPQAVESVGGTSEAYWSGIQTALKECTD